MKQILDHKIDGSQRRFQVLWQTKNEKNKREKSWEPEENLDGALDLLQKYCKNKRIAYSQIEGLCGSSNDIKDDRINWLSMDTIKEEYKKLVKYWNIEDKLACCTYQDFNKEDSIIFLRHRLHCYVLLYIKDSNLAYIADGANLYIQDEEINQDINETFRIKLIPLEYSQQKKDDHCGSSAVLIAGAMTRMYAKQEFEDKITVPVLWLERMVQRLHPHRSQAGGNPQGFGWRDNGISCSLCGKTFKHTQGRVLNMHKIHCRKSTAGGSDE